MTKEKFVEDAIISMVSAGYTKWSSKLGVDRLYQPKKLDNGTFVVRTSDAKFTSLYDKVAKVLLENKIIVKDTEYSARHIYDARIGEFTSELLIERRKAKDLQMAKDIDNLLTVEVE